MLEYRSPLSFEHVSSWEGLQHLRIQRSKNLQDCLQAKTESLKERTVYTRPPLRAICPAIEQFAQQLQITAKIDLIALARLPLK